MQATGSTGGLDFAKRKNVLKWPEIEEKYFGWHSGWQEALAWKSLLDSRFDGILIGRLSCYIIVLEIAKKPATHIMYVAGFRISA